MRLLRCLFLVLVVLWGVVETSHSQVCGDVFLPLDGLHELDDLFALTNHVLYGESFTPEQLANANLDGCGDVDIIDMAILSDYLFVSFVEPPCTTSTHCSTTQDSNQVRLVLTDPINVTLGDSSGRIDLQLSNPIDCRGISLGYVWNNPKFKLDSAVFQTLFSFDNKVAVRKSIDTTNARRQLLVAGTNFVLNVGVPAGLPFRTLVSYYFRVTNWQIGDSAVFEQRALDPSSTVRFIKNMHGGTSQLIFPCRFVLRDSASPSFLVPPNCLSAYVDTDGDALFDEWEIHGYDDNLDGIVDVDLPGMGANPLHKDLFVEIDWMASAGAEAQSHRPKAEAIDLIVAAFANAPLTNPDQINGINLHVDYGQGGAFTGGNEIPHQDVIVPKSGTVYDWMGFDSTIKSVNFAAPRHNIFRYSVFAHRCESDSSAACGLTRSIPASDFIVTLGGWESNPGTVKQQAGTFMHELGHSVGLKHGGGDSITFKPNYLSVMNFSFQTRGLIYNGAWNRFDYSRSTLTTLNESNLNESIGLNGGPPLVNYGTAWFCGTFQKWQSSVNSPLNWNCSGTATQTGVTADINFDLKFTSLSGYNDWANFRFVGGLVGGLSNVDFGLPNRVASASFHEEMTYEQHLLTGCCQRQTGNIDCDEDNLVDLPDLTVLVDHLFINFIPLCCEEAANVDGTEGIDLLDLTVLVDYLFISFAPTATCE